MPSRKRKYVGEPFNPINLHVLDNSVPEGYFYHSPKIVGIKFVSRQGHFRTMLIREFLVYRNQVQLLPGKEAKDYIISLIKLDILSERTDRLSEFIQLRPEPDNEYDSNAICVYAYCNNIKKNASRIGGQFHDIGYLPKEHAGLMKKEFKRYYLVGARPDREGLRLDIILCKYRKTYNSFSSSDLPEKKLVAPRVFSEFLTLKEMRKQLIV